MYSVFEDIEDMIDKMLEDNNIDVDENDDLHFEEEKIEANEKNFLLYFYNRLIEKHYTIEDLVAIYNKTFKTNITHKGFGHLRYVTKYLKAERKTNPLNGKRTYFYSKKLIY